MIKPIIKLTIVATLLWLIIVSGVLFLSLPDVTELVNKNPSSTSFIEMRKQQAAAKNKKLRIRQSWVRFSQIPTLLKQAIRITEDASFYKHGGVDYDELKEAIKRDLDEGQFSRGASTITQQLAKNLYLSSEKTIIRKIKEFLIARRLEQSLSKSRIYHLYLNIIELGPGIFGVQAAANYFYGRDISELSTEQIVRLTAIISRPLVENPRKNSDWLLWKSNWVLQKLLQYNYISQQEYHEVKSAFE